MDGTQDCSRCPVTGLTDREKQVLQASWSKLTGSTPQEMRAAVTELILWMFDNVPNMPQRFNNFSANSPREVLIANDKFMGHVGYVSLALDSMIKLLTNATTLEQKVREVARIHVLKKPSIGSQYFKPFQRKFHVFIESHLALPPDHEEVKLWTAFLGVLCEVVQQEEKAAGIVEKKGKFCRIL